MAEIKIISHGELNKEEVKLLKTCPECGGKKIKRLPRLGFFMKCEECDCVWMLEKTISISAGKEQK
jgi:ssDNA-binding Zn-finger/Zn-ribbon topoisomerase 1